MTDKVKEAAWEAFHDKWEELIGLGVAQIYRPSLDAALTAYDRERFGEDVVERCPKGNVARDWRHVNKARGRMVFWCRPPRAGDHIMSEIERTIGDAYQRASVCSFRDDRPKIFLEALRAAGYEVVPVEPTPKMSDAGVWTFIDVDRPSGQPYKAWQAMIKAWLDTRDEKE